MIIMDEQEVTNSHKDGLTSKPENSRRSARLNSKSPEPSEFPVSQATVISLSTCMLENQIKSPAVENVLPNDACFTAIDLPLKSELAVTSSATNLSVLTQSTVASSVTTAGKSCGPIRKTTKNSSKRRSKRLLSARIKYNRETRSRLFVKEQKASASHSSVVMHSGDYEELQKALLKNETSAPHCGGDQLDSKKIKFSHDDVDIDMETFSKIIASNVTSMQTVFNSSSASQSHSYLFKSVYGTDYHLSLLERERLSIERSKERHRINMNIEESLTSKCSGRPRTRSICREEEKELSRKISPSLVPAYIKTMFQSEITAGMRSILVDWIIGVANELSLLDETTHSSIKLMDRALEEIKVTLETFHTFGCACLLIAIKLNEVKRPRAVDIAFFTDSACTTKEICEMEMKICNTLKFKLQMVTAYHFLDRFLDASFLSMSTFYDNDKCAYASSLSRPQYCPKHHAMALFIIEMSLLLPPLVDVKDSLIAAATMYLTRAIIGVRDENGLIWNSHLTRLTGYSVQEFADIVLLIHVYHKGLESDSTMQTVLKKYSSTKFHNVALKASILTEDLMLPMP